MKTSSKPGVIIITVYAVNSPFWEQVIMLLLSEGKSNGEY